MEVASSTVCAGCGQPLSCSDTCWACLLRVGLEETDIPTRFGDYEIVRREDGMPCELGRGAMGVTYRARDTVLHRDVALKVIDPPAGAHDSAAMGERFLREARAAAALRHPNVATVFHFSAAPEINRCYCAMELVEGETLEMRVRRDGPINVAVALEIAAQVTRALTAAAERGLVHRDLKPGNIMLTGGNGATPLQVKVIDFGLAKAATAGAGEMELTHGQFVGTPAFASPEQFAGGIVDSRSDVYALGATLWFALTGQLPYAGSTIEEVRRNQQHQPLPLEQMRAKGVPPHVTLLLRSCLASAAADRPAPAELLRLLERCRAQPAARRRQLVLAGIGTLVLAVAVILWQGRKRDVPAPAVDPTHRSIAVLPFDNLSTDAADAFFADGIREDVSTSVGKIKDLKVIARTSVMDYRGAAASGKMREVGRDLGVSHLLTGSVRRDADRVVVNVSLIETATERQVWAERYERLLSDTLSLQGELAVEIAHALQATLTPLEHSIARVKPTENTEAYLVYLRAREIDATPNADLNKAIGLYQQAIDLDSNFALARARLSIVASNLSYTRGDSQWQTKARAEAEEALRLQPDLGEARLAMSHCYLYQERDYERALAELARAAELLPNSAEVQMIAGFIYKRQNRFRERLAAFRRAEELDPRNQMVSSAIVMTLRWVRDWPEALHALDRRSILSPGPAYVTSPWSRANDEFRLTGNIEVLKRATAAEAAAGIAGTAERLNFARFETAMFERDYASAARFLGEIPAEAFPEKLFMISVHPKPFHEALLAVARGSDPTEKEQALAQAEAMIGATLRPNSTGRDGARALAEMAMIHAFGGRKEEAIREARRAVDFKEARPGSVEKNDLSSALALVYAQTGEPEKALELIEHLLTVPTEVQSGAVYNMTLVDLRWRWVWDPLRNHPRFQQLLAGPEPKTIY